MQINARTASNRASVTTPVLLSLCAQLALPDQNGEA